MLVAVAVVVVVAMGQAVPVDTQILLKHRPLTPAHILSSLALEVLPHIPAAVRQPLLDFPPMVAVAVVEQAVPEVVQGSVVPKSD